MSRPALGPRRPGPQRLHLQRQRHHRGLRLGPRDRRSTGRSPTAAAARTPPTLPPDGDDRLVVRRHRRRRVRALGHASRSPAGAANRVEPARARRRGRLPGRAGDRAAAGRRRHLHRRRHHDLAAPRRRARPRSSTPHTEDAGRRRAVRGRDAAGDQPLRARRLAPPGTCACCPGRRRRARSPRSPTGPGKGLAPLAFAPVAGDQRLLVLHERRGREELLLWDVAAGTETELAHRPARRADRRLLPRTRRRCWSGTRTPPAPGCTATTWRPAR